VVQFHEEVTSIEVIAVSVVHFRVWNLRPFTLFIDVSSYKCKLHNSLLIFMSPYYSA